jgi:hypothetical protein
MQPTHPWRARIVIAVFMLALAFIGIVVTNLQIEGGWNYWRWVVPIYALLSLWLSWYMRRQMQTIAPYTLLHELCHWICVLISVYITSLYVHLGILSRLSAGLIQLNLLSLGVFLAGVYIERSMLIIGLVLAALAIFSAILTQYLYLIMIPLTLAALLVIGLMVWHSHKKVKNG